MDSGLFSVGYVPGLNAFSESSMRDPTIYRSMLDHFATPAETLGWRNFNDETVERKVNVLLSQLTVGGTELRGVGLPLKGL